MSLYDREGIEKYERSAFFEQVEVEKEEIISALKMTVSCWTENQLEDWNTPVFENFIHEFPEWNHDELYETIAAEMERVRGIVESEKRGRISGVS